MTKIGQKITTFEMKKIVIADLERAARSGRHL